MSRRFLSGQDITFGLFDLCDHVCLEASLVLELDQPSQAGQPHMKTTV